MGRIDLTPTRRRTDPGDGAGALIDDAGVRPTLLISLALPFLVGGLGLVHGSGFMAGFNTTPLPALASLSPAVAAPRVSPPRDGRVLLVVVDGLRADFAHHLGLVAPTGAAHAACQLESVVPSYSRPAYVALSTGVPPWASGVHTNDHEGPVTLPSIWALATAAGVHTHLLADGTDWWIDLFPGGFERIDMVPKERFDAFFDTLPPPPPGALVLLHLVAADDAAHDLGTGPAYVAEIRRAGAKIRRLLDRLDPTRDTLFVTADHGHIDRGGHGGTEPEVLAVPFIGFGAGITPFPGDAADPWCGSILDVPVAIAARLGLAPPTAGLGSLPPIVLPAHEDFSAALAAQSVAVHDALGPAGPNPVMQGRARPLSLRGLALALGAWLMVAFALARLLVVGGAARSLASALALPLAGVASYALFEPTVSLSAVWLERPWTLHLGLIAGAASALASLFVHARHAPHEALALMSLGAALPPLLALGAHGSLSAGPVLGDPHAAFALAAADLFAGAALAVALLASCLASLDDRRRGRHKVWV